MEELSQQEERMEKEGRRTRRLVHTKKTNREQQQQTTVSNVARGINRSAAPETIPEQKVQKGYFESTMPTTYSTHSKSLSE